MVLRRKDNAQERDETSAMLHRFGLDDVGDRPVAALSLGRARLVELARALMCEPRLLLLDEPSSGLDTRESEVVAQRLREVNEAGVAMLLVEHDIAMVRSLAQRVYVLDFGTVIASGTAHDVFGAPKHEYTQALFAAAPGRDYAFGN